MDTKSKSSRNIRIILTILILILGTVITVELLPQIGRQAEKQLEEPRMEEAMAEHVIRELQGSSYVLCLENSGINTGDFYWDDYSFREMWNTDGWMTNLDYYVKSETEEKCNTFRSLQELTKENRSPEVIRQLKEEYEGYWVLKFDEDGTFTVEDVWSASGKQEDIIKQLIYWQRQNDTQFQDLKRMADYTAASEIVKPDGQKMLFANCWVVYGFESESLFLEQYEVGSSYWNRIQAYMQSGTVFLYYGTFAVLVLLMFLLTSNTIWRGTIDYHKRRGPWYLAEAAVIGIICFVAAVESFTFICAAYVPNVGSGDLLTVLQYGTMEDWIFLLEILLSVGAVYTGWYICCLIIRPLFSLGIKEYIRQYSLIYLILHKCADFLRWGIKKIKVNLERVDLSEKSNKVLIKAVAIQFVFLAVLSCFWFFGIFLLAVYSVGLFFYLLKQYQKVQHNYDSMLEMTRQLAKGNLRYEDSEDWGLFRGMKPELGSIKEGFSNAVEEEVKSQRMKTELITNVSHDLKTPLTAITTYVELLKDPDLSPEQRAEYVAVLEKKSLRLKVLIEDLFEVSKATSRDIKLDLMEVDVVNLIKQVTVEHADKFREAGLDLRCEYPEEKLILTLDNQKTYRIFENLFVNIEKYAMPNSRVYVQVTTDEAHGEITLKNMSAAELNITPEELTERFVRGDASRNTEGSGLGLAIARSFVEAQGGGLTVQVDGDLFKVTICFPKRDC